MSRRQPQRDTKPPRLLLPSQRAKQQANAQGISHETAASAAQPTAANAEHKAAGVQHAGSAMSNGSATNGSTAEALNLPLGSGVRLLAWHPCGLYVLDKPEGVLSHPNKKAEIDRSLLRAPYSLEHEYFYNLQEAPPETKLYLLHRLDSATSGLLLLADNETLAHSIRTAFAENSVRKTYYALCATAGDIRAGQKGRWSDRLQREHSGAGGSVVHVKASNSGLLAVTDFSCRKTSAHNNALALLELHPLSGRTHQLRVHCAGHGLPIIGDAKYGDFRLNRAIAKESGHKRLFLHAAALQLNFTLNGRQLRLQFASPLPEEFDALLTNPPEFSRPTPARTGSLRQHTAGQQTKGQNSKGQQSRPHQGRGKQRR